MAPFVDMFPDADIVLFNSRGHEAAMPAFPWLESSKWVRHGLGSLCGVFGPSAVDLDKVTWGVREAEDVAAIVNHFKTTRATSAAVTGYREVVGLGMCFAAGVFASAQNRFSGLFTKMIIDSAWLSLDRAICGNLGGRHAVSELAKKGFARLLGYPVGIDELFGRAIAGLTVPTLFIQSRTDDLTFFDDLMALAATVKAPHVVIETPCKHARNHLQCRGQYQAVCSEFIGNEFGGFVRFLQGNGVAPSDWMSARR